MRKLIYVHLLSASVASFALLCIPLSAVQADEAALDAIHQKILRKYDSVEHIAPDDLSRDLADPEKAADIVLFDVREVGEHDVSHLANATQIKPGIWTSTFLRRHGERIKDKTVVFYCSVGRRSSYAASYLQGALKKSGARRVVNLKGGIFSWHNQKRDLSNGETRTPFVHPYNKYWGRLIERRSLIRFKPTAVLDANGSLTNGTPSVSEQTSQ